MRTYQRIAAFTSMTADAFQSLGRARAFHLCSRQRRPDREAEVVRPAVSRLEAHLQFTTASIWHKLHMVGACGVMALLLLLPVFGFNVAWAQAPAPNLIFGSGTAAIDGVVSTGEWAMAHCLAIDVNVPEGTTPGTVCAMNDGFNLYLSMRFARPAADPGNSAAFEFDNDRSGGLTTGDDILLINPDIGFFDEVRVACGVALCGLYDTDMGGTNDGSGAFVNDGGFTTYEFSHPLNSSDDAHDFSLNLGDSIDFWLFVRIIPPSNTIFDTDRVPGRILVTVPIEIGREKINSRSNAPIAVAILSTASFDVPATLNPNSLTFGRTGDEASLRSCRYHDADRDGTPDLVCQFGTQQAGFQPGDTQGILKGTRLDGSPIVGIAPVAIR